MATRDASLVISAPALIARQIMALAVPVPVPAASPHAPPGAAKAVSGSGGGGGGGGGGGSGSVVFKSLKERMAGGLLRTSTRPLTLLLLLGARLYQR